MPLKNLSNSILYKIFINIQYLFFKGWKEVYDPGCARHYYWCPRTDEVSWLPPRHPLAVIGDAAPKVSKGLFVLKKIFYQINSTQNIHFSSRINI